MKAIEEKIFGWVADKLFEQWQEWDTHPEGLTDFSSFDVEKNFGKWDNADIVYLRTPVKFGDNEADVLVRLSYYGVCYARIFRNSKQNRNIVFAVSNHKHGILTLQSRINALFTWYGLPLRSKGYTIGAKPEFEDVTDEAILEEIAFNAPLYNTRSSKDWYVIRACNAIVAYF